MPRVEFEPVARPPRGLGWRTRGGGLLLGGTTAICGSALLAGAMPSPWFSGAGPQVQLAVLPLVIVAAALAVLGLFEPKHAAWAVAGFWGLAAASAAIGTVSTGSVTSVVALSEAIVLGTATLVLLNRLRRMALLVAIAAMLAVFGAVHLLHREAIASLIPEGFPFREAWPLATGAVMLCASASLAIASLRRRALTIVALMFGAWLPLVHVPRVLAGPILDETTFAATAVALIGALVLASWAGTGSAEQRRP